MKSVQTYLIHIFIGFDQFFTTIVGGWPDETLSSYAYRMHQQRKPWGRFWMPVIDAMFFLQGPEHCRRAYESDKARMQMPPELR